MGVSTWELACDDSLLADAAFLFHTHPEPRNPVMMETGVLSLPVLPIAFCVLERFAAENDRK